MAADLETLIGGMPPHEEGVRYLNRELSWLDFNARVLAIADRSTTPPLERAKFIAIFSQNLDEFFQVRVAGLKDQVAAGFGKVSPDGRGPGEQLTEIRTRVLDLLRHEERVLIDELLPLLAEAGVCITGWSDLAEDDRAHLTRVFDEQVFPVLTPLAVDPAHPFPYISSLSLNLAVRVRDTTSGEHRFARVKVPDILPRFVALPDRRRHLPLESLIAHHLDALFPGMAIESHHAFRVTRNVDLTVDEGEADDLLAAVEIELRRRRFGRAVRLEVDAAIAEDTLALLVRELDLQPDDVYPTVAPIDLGALWDLWHLPRGDLKDRPFRSVPSASLIDDEDETVDLFARLREGDILLHHPYESFTTSVEAFVRQAARDPQVLAIKQTLYRTSSDSPIVAALIDAATEGKQVVALVELKARFDESANVTWARALERAGVHVVYGLVGLKTHTKTLLVVRQDTDGVRRYCHIGTGNYNGRTARSYEDLGLLTCDPALGADLSQLFNHLTGYSRQERFARLLVAPGSLRSRLVDLIAAEAHPGGSMTMKMNSLTDPQMVDALYEASAAGAEIDLIVRGICCLRPGVPGLSEGIRVRSLVGRFLEHSRIYRFGGASGHVSYFIGSADLMERNLDRRVEALVPVQAPDLQARLQQVLDVNLADDVLAWQLGPEGSWTKVPTTQGIDTHEVLEQLAAERAERATPRPKRRPW